MVPPMPATRAPSLKDTASPRVTKAAVFLEDGREPVYLLPEGIRLAAGFQSYDDDRHHLRHKSGVLCCGNCYEDGRIVPIHHRAATEPRIGGGDEKGHSAAFCANPDTVSDHTEDCQKRRELSRTRAAFPFRPVTFNFNDPLTYTGKLPAQALRRVVRTEDGFRTELQDPRLTGREPYAINEFSDYIAITSRLSRDQVQSAMYAIDGHLGEHWKVCVDGDGWKVLHDRMDHRSESLQLPRIFHVHSPTSMPRRDFLNAAQPESIPLQDYQFRDDTGFMHVMQPSVVTQNPAVKAQFEKAGDRLLLARFVHKQVVVHGKDKLPVFIHRIQIHVNEPGQVIELYQNGSRIRDYNAIDHLRGVEARVTPVDHKPPRRMRASSAAPGQQDLFGMNFDA